MNKRIVFLIIICIALLFAGCGSVQKDVAGSDSSIGVQFVRQIVAEDNATCRTIMWQSQVRQDYSVEYRLKCIGNNGVEHDTVKKASDKVGTVFTKAATECSFKEAKTDYLQYQVQLQGLQPNSIYEYRIVTAKSKGTWHSIKTDNDKGFTALIFPDSQSSDYSGWQQLARAAQQRHKDSELYINMGDLVDNGQDGSQWRAWLGSVEPFSADTAFAPVIGNHEA